MLAKLTIKNVALIESAEIEFLEGLNVLSGETGAGKSVILDSLNFVLGAKADRTMTERFGSIVTPRIPMTPTKSLSWTTSMTMQSTKR